MTLPSTWREVRLSEVCEINPRLIPGDKPPDDEIVTFLPMSAVDEVLGEILRPEQKAYKEVAKGFTPFKEGDVLFAKITPSMENGKAAVARGLINGIGFGSTEFHVLRPVEHLLSEYLFYFIRMPAFRNWAKASFVGTAGQQRVPTQFLERVPLPLPTIPEQQRIVDILKQADELRRQRWEILKQAKKLPFILFLEMFGNPLLNPKGYQKWRLGELIKVKSGQFLPSKNMDSKGEYPVYGGNGVTGYHSSYMFDYSTIVIGRVGVYCGAVHHAPAKSWITDNALYVEDKSSDLDDRYLEYALRIANLNQYSGQAAQPLISASRIYPIKILVPSLELQARFSKMLDVFERQIQRIEFSESELQILIDLLQSGTFSGKLTNQWREAQREELETWLREQADRLPKKPARISFRETAPTERPAPSLRARRWLMNQLSEVQSHAYEALREWKGTLIPSEDLDRFLEEWPVEHLEDGHDHMLRAINQLVGLGLVAQVSVPSQAGEYVTGYRMSREDEKSRVDDIEALNPGKE